MAEPIPQDPEGVERDRSVQDDPRVSLKNCHAVKVVAKLDLETHLPIIGDFWETLLFRTGDYARHGRNPLHVHIELDKKIQLTREHFQRWLEIFSATVDSLFAGETAEFIKMRSAAIAVRMLEALGHAPQGRQAVPLAAVAEP